MHELTIKEIQEIAFDILKEFAYFCESNGLTYYLAYGTLLGAIRHKGFIPWDDDIDVLMPRPDYELFKKLYKDNCRYKLYSAERQKEYPYPYMKLVDTDTFQILNNGRKIDRGVDIDIFVLDGQETDREQSYKGFQKYVNPFMKTSVKLIQWQFIGNSESIKKRIQFLIACLLLKCGVANKLANRFDRSANRFDYEKCNFVSPFVGSFFGTFWFFAKEDFEPPRKADFENESFYIPNNAEKFLSTRYGDYMQLPSEENRVSIHMERYYRKD